MENYGFVYLWYDKKHKRFYIGCRWGHENDGYVCSSAWMKQGFKHRPFDFRRRVLKKIYTNKKDLLEEEYRWLSMIKSNELGKKYYNLYNHHFGHWSSNTGSKLTVAEKISASPNRAANISKAMKGRKPADHTIEATRRRHLGKTYEEIHGVDRAKEIKEKKRMNAKHAVWTDDVRKIVGEKARQRMTGTKLSDETKKKMRESHKRRYAKMKEIP
jgi:hypothetical protein